jgi:putative MATE family efflux protein
MSNDDKKRYLILKDPNIIKGIFFLSIPLMLANFMRTLHDLVDTYFVSSIPGFAEEAISSIGVTFPVTFTYLSLGIGLSIAGTALISQYYGNGQFKTARKYATQLMVISILIGLLLNVASYFLAPSIFRAMGAEGYVFENAVAYIRVRSFELTPVFMFFAFQSIRQATGDTTTPTILSVSAIIINIILTPFLVLDTVEFFDLTINGFGLGVPGAAYATLIANGSIMPIGLLLLFKSSSGVTLRMNYAKLEKTVAKDLIFTAVPASLGQAITAIGFAVLNTFILDYGENVYSAFQIGNRISSLILMPVMAIGAIMASYIGQNIGNLNPKRAKKAFYQGLLLSVGIMIIGSTFAMFIRPVMIGLFLDPGTESFNLSMTYMFFLLLGLPLMAIYQAYIGLYNGTGRTIYTLITGVTRLWGFRIPFILFFKNFTDLGSSGIWYAMLLSNFGIAIVGLFFLKRITFQPKINIEPTLQ